MKAFKAIVVWLFALSLCWWLLCGFGALCVWK